MSAAPLQDEEDRFHAETEDHAEGCVDAVTDDLLFGWAWYPGNPDRKVILDILAEDEVVGTVIADQLRDDLAANGVGDGHHAFSYRFRENGIERGRLSVRVKGTARALPVVAQAADASPSATVAQQLAASRRETAHLTQQIAQCQSVIQALTARLVAVEESAAATEAFLMRIDKALKRLKAEAPQRLPAQASPLWMLAAAVTAGFAAGALAIVASQSL